MRVIATHRMRGFTLVELVVAMSIASIVVAFMAMFITSPVHAYRGQVRRAEMVDTADNTLRDMARDIRAALPNSVRLRTSGTRFALEIIAAQDALRYRSTGASANPAQELDFTLADAQFNTIGCPTTTSVRHLSIYNVGIPGANAYEMINVITPATTNITIGACTAGESQITLTTPFKFAYGSPQQRVYFISGPVSFVCDTADGTLTRFSGYAIDPTQPIATSDFTTGSSALVAQNLSNCIFAYSPGTAERASLVTLDMTISRTDPTFSSQAERVRLLHQVHVENAP